MKNVAYFFVVSLTMLVACGDPIVSGSCASGYAIQGSRCVPVNSTTDGGTEGGVEGGMPDGGDGGGMMTDGGGMMTDGGGMMTDGGGGNPPTGCPLGQIECNDNCIDPETSNSHCGGCGMPCMAPNPVCIDGVCQSSCMAPRVLCGAACVNPNSNRTHCGGCGITCIGGCTNGSCDATAPGHLVIVGHDYIASNSSMDRIAGNGVFIPSGASINVLTYEGTAANAAVSGINGAIDSVATLQNRTWRPPLGVTKEEVTFALKDVDTFVIYPQAFGTNEEIRDLGATWGQALQDFLRRGGTIVLFDGNTAHDGTWQILDEAGLFEASSKMSVTDEVHDVDLPLSVIAIGVPVQYTGRTNSVAFDTMEANVIVSSDGAPVVIHKVVRP